MLSQHAELMSKDFRRAEGVPDVCVPGDDPQHQLFARSADHQRRARLLQRLRLAVGFDQLIILSGKRRLPFGPQSLDDFAGFVNAANALGSRIERDAVSRMLHLEPAGADAHNQSPAARVI